MNLLKNLTSFCHLWLPVAGNADMKAEQHPQVNPERQTTQAEAQRDKPTGVTRERLAEQAALADTCLSDSEFVGVCAEYRVTAVIQSLCVGGKWGLGTKS